MYKTKIFFGCITSKYPNADSACNDWLDKNQNIEIVKFRYSHGSDGWHSICILYREKTK